MAGRKSSASVGIEPDTHPDSSVTKTSTNAAKGKDKAKDKHGLGIEDLGLPKSMVQRLAKGVLPANTQIQRDAQLAIWKSATVFVNYLASTADEHAQRLSKKTIQPNNVLDAIKDLEFDGFMDRLQAELDKYNIIQSEKRTSYRKKGREETKPSSGATATASSPTTRTSLTPASASATAHSLSNPISDSTSPQGGIPFELPPSAAVSSSSRHTSRDHVAQRVQPKTSLSFEDIAPHIPPTVSRTRPRTLARDEPMAKKVRQRLNGSRTGHGLTQERKDAELLWEEEMNQPGKEEEEEEDEEDDEEEEEEEQEEDDDEEEEQDDKGEDEEFSQDDDKSIHNETNAEQLSGHHFTRHARQRLQVDEAMDSDESN